MTDKTLSRGPGRPPVADPMVTIFVQARASTLAALPKNAKGNPDQKWIREALAEKLDDESIFRAPKAQEES